MIVKNEDDVIGRCLECVKDVVDKIIIVNTGSTNSTIEIVKNIPIKSMILTGQMISPIHEVIPPSGNILYSNIAIAHKKLHPSDKNRNLRILIK